MTLKPDHMLAHYRLVEKIGEGGMGVVWKAVDSKLDREVAIKILPDELSRNGERLERFQREAKAIAALNHPNIITIHSIEEHEGRRFLVMELVEGGSLDRLIRPGGLPLSQVFEVAIRISDALASAHEKGIIHRDIKPANVMLTGDGQVKVLDFSLAKIAAGTDATDRGQPTQVDTRSAALTGEGAVLGTAPYMSPEQLQGHPTDHRTDIFSLGILLYEMVTGNRPFKGDSGLTLASSTLKDTPQSITELRAESPRHLGRIIEQCLEKNPGRRFQTARDVCNQLRSLRRETTSEMGTVARRPAGGGGMRRAVLGVAGLVVVAAVSYALWNSRGVSEGENPAAPAVLKAESARRKMVVVLPFENVGAPEDEYFADGITDEITSRLLSVEGLGIISRSTAMHYKEDRPALAQIGEELGVDYILDGTVRWQRSSSGPGRVRVTPELIRVSDDTQMWSEVYDRVLADLFEVQSDIALQVSGQLGSALLEPQLQTLAARSTENMEAYDSYLQGNDYLNRSMDLDSEDDAGFAVRLYRQALELDPDFALAHAKIARAHNWIYKGYWDRTTKRITLAREAANRALELSPELPEAHHALGQLLDLEGNHELAMEEFEKVLAAQPNNAEVYDDLSDAQRSLGLWKRAAENKKKGLELNPRMGRLACSTGGVFFGLRDFPEAVRYHDKAIRTTPDRACPYFCEVRIYLNWDGGTTRARQVLEELPAGLGLEEEPPINYPWVLAEMIDGDYQAALDRLSSGPAEAYIFRQFYIPKDLLYGQIFALMGQPESATKHYDAARLLLEERLREDPDDHRVRGSLGIAYAGLGRKGDAIREGKRGLSLLEGDQSLVLGERTKEMAAIYLMVGEYDLALARLEVLLSMPSHYSVSLLRVDPTWRELRPHPGFQALLERHEGDGITS